jgi:hypothetical protein
MSLPAEASWLSLLGPYAAASVALLAAVASFSASWLTIRNAQRALRLQLEHDAEGRDRERTMALKRDVYIPIVQAISHAQAMLGQLIDPDRDNNALAEQIAEDLSTMAKIHAVGSEQTISAMMEYLKVLAPAHFQFMLARADLVSRKQAIARESALMEAAEAAMQRFKEFAGELHIAGNGDARVARLKELVDSEVRSHKEHMERRAQLIKQQAEAQLVLLDQLVAVLGRLGDLLPDVVLAARRDLDIPLGSAEYRQLFVQQQQAVMQAVRNVQEQLKQLIGQ